MRAVLATDELLGRAMALALRHGNIETRIVSDPTLLMSETDEFDAHMVMVDADRTPDAVRRIRQRAGDGKIGVIALARRRKLTLKMALFEMGADDLIEAPFTPDEMFGRPVGLAKKLGLPKVDFVQTVSANGIELDLAEERVRVDGVWRPLSITDLAVAYLFAANPDVIFTAETVNDNLWGPDFRRQSDEISTRLRAMLGESGGGPRVIESVGRDAYRLAA